YFGTIESGFGPTRHVERRDEPVTGRGGGGGRGEQHDARERRGTVRVRKGGRRRHVRREAPPGHLVVQRASQEVILAGDQKKGAEPAGRCAPFAGAAAATSRT